MNSDDRDGGALVLNSWRAVGRGREPVVENQTTRAGTGFVCGFAPLEDPGQEKSQSMAFWNGPVKTRPANGPRGGCYSNTQRSEASRKTERGIRKTERGIRKTERGIRKTERGIRKTERGIRKTERGIRKTERGIRKAERGIGVRPID